MTIAPSIITNRLYDMLVNNLHASHVEKRKPYRPGMAWLDAQREALITATATVVYGRDADKLTTEEKNNVLNEAEHRYNEYTGR